MRVEFLFLPSPLAKFTMGANLFASMKIGMKLRAAFLQLAAIVSRSFVPSSALTPDRGRSNNWRRLPPG